LSLTVESNSDEEAQQDRRRLEMLIERVLAENSELGQKLHQSEVCSRLRTTIVPTIRESRHMDQASARDQTPTREIIPPTTVSEQAAIIRFAFEPVLQASRVYLRHEQRNECDMSFSSIAQRSHAWSELAGYSLADISILSVIAMPLTTADIATGSYHYTVTDTRVTKGALKRLFGRDCPMGIMGDGEYRVLVPRRGPRVAIFGPDY